MVMGEKWQVILRMEIIYGILEGPDAHSKGGLFVDQPQMGTMHQPSNLESIVEVPFEWRNIADN